jgi:hypothetical protein
MQEPDVVTQITFAEGFAMNVLGQRNSMKNQVTFSKFFCGARLPPVMSHGAEG